MSTNVAQVLAIVVLSHQVVAVATHVLWVVEHVLLQVLLQEDADKKQTKT